MAAPTGDGGGSPLSGCYLLLVLSEPHRPDHRPLILQRVVKGLASWDQRECGVDLGQELQALIDANPDGEQFKFGERLIQFATENVVAEILVNPQVYTFQQCLKNMLASFTRHRHLIHAGYVFSGNGSWILQDGTFSGSDLLDALRETDVQRVTRAYESSLSVHIHCPEEGIWRSEALLKDPVFAASKVSMNPPDRDSAPPQVAAFREYLSGFLTPASLEDLLNPSDVVGNIRFSRPTLYVFPGGQGDAAMFGINGFNILFDGGFSRRACCWNFVRHLDRLDAVLMSRLNNGNLMGMSAMLQRKVDNATYPQMGHFFANLVDQKSSVDVNKDADPLLVNTQLETQRLLDNLKALSLKPTPCLRENSNDPINLYHKVGHGRLDLYVLNPQKDANEMQAFLKSWTDGPDQSRVTLRVKGREFPVANLVSICCLLVWVPDDRHDTVTRLLFPGSTPQQKVFEGLDRLKHLDFMKTPVCYVKSLGAKKHKTLDTLLKSGPKAPPSGTRVERIERVEVEQKRRVRSTSRQTRNGDTTDAVKKPDRGDKELLAEIKAKKQEANRERAERAPTTKPKPSKQEKVEPPKEARPMAVSRPKKTKAPKDDNKQADDSSEGKNGSIASLPKDEKEATPVKAKKDVSNKMIVEEKKVSRTMTKAKQTKAETKARTVESRVISKVTEARTMKTGETKKAAEKGKARPEPKAEKPTGARSRVKPPASPKHVRSIKPKAAQTAKPPATSTPNAKSSQEQEVSTMRGTGDIEEVTMAGDMLTVTKVTTEVQRFIEEVQEGDSLEQMSGDVSREIETDSLELRKVDEKIDSLKQSPTTEDSKDLRQSSEEVLRRTDIEEAVLLRATSEQKSPPRPSEEQMKLTDLEKASAQKKDAVKTPDEVAELPEHEALELPEHEVQHLPTAEPLKGTDNIQRVMTTSHEPPTEEDTEKEKESVAEEQLTSPKSEKDELNRRTKDSSPEEPPDEELPSADAGGETQESPSPSPGYVEAGEPSPKNSRQLEDICTSPRRDIYPIGEPYVESGVEAVTRHETVQRERAEMVMLASSTTTPSPSSPSRDRWTTETPHLPSVDERSLEEALPRDVSTASGVTELSTVKIEDLYGDADKVAPETQVETKEDGKKDVDLKEASKDDLKTGATKEIEVADKIAHQAPKKAGELDEHKEHVDDTVADEKQRLATEELPPHAESKPQVPGDDDEKIKAFLGEQALLVQGKTEPSEVVTVAHSALDTGLQETYPSDRLAGTKQIKPTVEEAKDLERPTEPDPAISGVQPGEVVSDKPDKDEKVDDAKSQVTLAPEPPPADILKIGDKAPTQEPPISAPGERLRDTPAPDKEVSQAATEEAKDDESFQPAVTSEKPSPQELKDSRDMREDESQISAFLQEQAALVQTKAELSATTTVMSQEPAKPADIPSGAHDEATHEETRVASDADIPPSVEDLKDLRETEKLVIDKQVEAGGKRSPSELHKEEKEAPVSKEYDEPLSVSKAQEPPGSPNIALQERHEDPETATKPNAKVTSLPEQPKDLDEPEPTVHTETQLPPDSKAGASLRDEDQISVAMKEQASLVQDQAKPSERTPPVSPGYEKPSPPVIDSRDIQEKRSPEAVDVDSKRSPDIVESLKEPTDLSVGRSQEDAARDSPTKSVPSAKPDILAEQAEPSVMSPMPGKSSVKEIVGEIIETVEKVVKPSEKGSELEDGLKVVGKAQQQKVGDKEATSVSKTSPGTQQDDKSIAAFLQEQASLIQAQKGDEAEVPKDTVAKEAVPSQPTEPVSVESKPVKDEIETGKQGRDPSPVQRIEEGVTPAEVEATATPEVADNTVSDKHVEDHTKSVERSPTKGQDDKKPVEEASIPVERSPNTVQDEKKPVGETITQERREVRQISPEAPGQQVEEISNSSEISAMESEKAEILETVQTSTYTSLDTSLTSVSSITKTEEKADFDTMKHGEKVSEFMTEQVGLVKPEPAEDVKKVTETPVSATIDKTPSPETIAATSRKTMPEADSADKAISDEDQSSKLKLPKDTADEAQAVRPSTPETAAGAHVKSSPKQEDEVKLEAEVSAPISTPAAPITDVKGEKPAPAKTEEAAKTQPATELKPDVPDLVKPADVRSELSLPVEDSRYDDKAHTDAFLAEQADLIKESQHDVVSQREHAIDTHVPDTVGRVEDRKRNDALLTEQAELTGDDKNDGESGPKDILDEHLTAARTPEPVEKEPITPQVPESKQAQQHLELEKAAQETIQIKQIPSEVAASDYQEPAKFAPSDVKDENREVKPDIQAPEKREHVPAPLDKIEEVKPSKPSEETLKDEARRVDKSDVRAPVPAEEKEPLAERSLARFEKTKDVKPSKSPEEAFFEEQAALVMKKAEGKYDVRDESTAPSLDLSIHKSSDKKEESPVATVVEAIQERSLMAEEQKTTKGPEQQLKRPEDETKAADLQRPDEAADTTVTAKLESPEKVSQVKQVELVKEGPAILEEMPIKETKQDAGITIDETVPTKQADEPLQKTDRKPHRTDAPKPVSQEKTYLRGQAELVKGKTDLQEDVPSKETKPVADITMEEAITTKQTDDTIQKIDKTLSDVTTRSGSQEKAFQREEADLKELEKEKAAFPEKVPSKGVKPEAVMTTDETAHTQKAEGTLQKTDRTPGSIDATRLESPERAFLGEQAEKAVVKVEAIVKETKIVESVITTKPESPDKAFLQGQIKLMEEKAAVHDIPDKEIKPEAVSTIDTTITAKQTDDTIQKTDQFPASDVARPETPEKGLEKEAEIEKEEKLNKEKAAVPESIPGKEVKPVADITTAETAPAKSEETLQRTDRTPDSTDTARLESSEKLFIREQAELVKEKADVQEVIVKETRKIVESVVTTKPEPSEKVFLGQQADLVKEKTDIQDDVPSNETKPVAGITIDKDSSTKETDETIQRTDGISSVSDVVTRSDLSGKAFQEEEAMLEKDKTAIPETAPSGEIKPDAGITTDLMAPTKQAEETIEKADRTPDSTGAARSESPEKAFLREQAELVKDKGPIQDVIVKETKQAVDSTVTTGPESPEKAFLREQAELVEDKAPITEAISGKGIKPDVSATGDGSISTKQADKTIQRKDKTPEILTTDRSKSPEKVSMKEQTEDMKEKAGIQEDTSSKETKTGAITAGETVATKQIYTTKQTQETESTEKVETSQSESTSITHVSSSPSRQMTTSFIESESSEMQPPSLTESTTSEVSVTGTQSKKTSYIIEEYEVISPRRRQQYEDVEEIVTYSPTTKTQEVSEVTVVSSIEKQSSQSSERQVSVEKLSQETASVMQKTAGITAEKSEPISISVKAEKVEMAYSGRSSFGDVEEIEEVVSVQKSPESHVQPAKRVDDVGVSAEAPVRSSTGVDDLVAQIQTTEARTEKSITDDIAGIEEQVMSVQTSYGSYAEPPLREESVSTMSTTAERRDVDEDDLMSQILRGKDIATDIVSSAKPTDTTIISKDAHKPGTGEKSTAEDQAKEKAKPAEEDAVEEKVQCSSDRMVCGKDDVSLPHKLAVDPALDHSALSPTSAQAEIENALLQTGAGLVAKSSSYETLAAEAGKLDDKPAQPKASAKPAERDLDSLLSQIQTYEESMPTLPDSKGKQLSPITDAPPPQIHPKQSPEDITSKLKELGSSVDKIMKVKPDKIRVEDVCIGEDDGADYAMDAEGPIVCKKIADLGPIPDRDGKAPEGTPSPSKDKPADVKPSDEDKHPAETPKAIEKEGGEAKAPSPGKVKLADVKSSDEDKHSVEIPKEMEQEGGEAKNKTPEKSPTKEHKKTIPAESTSDKPIDASPKDDSWLDEQINEVTEKTRPTSKHIAAYPATTVKSPRRKIVDSPDLSDEDLLTDEAKAKTDSAKSSPEEKTTPVAKPDSTKDGELPGAQASDSRAVTPPADLKAAPRPADDGKAVPSKPDDGKRAAAPKDDGKATSAPAKDASPSEPQPIVLVKDEAKQVDQKGSARDEPTAPTPGEMGWIEAEPPADKRPVSASEDASQKSEEATVKSEVAVPQDIEPEHPKLATETDTARTDDIDARPFKPSEVSSQFLMTEDSMNGNAKPCSDGEGAVIHELMDAGGILSAFVPGVAERFEDLHHDEHAEHVPATPSDAAPGPAKQADAAPCGAVAGVASAEQSISPTAPSVVRRDQGEGPGAAPDVADGAEGRSVGWIAEKVSGEAQVVTVADAAKEVETKGARRDSVGSPADGLKTDTADEIVKQVDDVAAPGVIQITDTATIAQDVGGGKQTKPQVEKLEKTEMKDATSSEPAAKTAQAKHEEPSTDKVSLSKEADTASQESTVDQLSHLAHDAIVAAESEAEKVVSSISTTLSSLVDSAGARFGIPTQTPTVEDSSTVKLSDKAVASPDNKPEKTIEESTTNYVSGVVDDTPVAAEEQAERAASSISTTLSTLAESASAGLGLTAQKEVVEKPSTATSLGDDASFLKEPARPSEESTVSHLGHLVHDALDAAESEAEKAAATISSTFSSLAESAGLTTHTDAAKKSPEAPVKDEKTSEQAKGTTKTTEESTVSHLGHVVHDTIAVAEPGAEKVVSTITTTLSSLVEGASVGLGISAATEEPSASIKDLPGDKPVETSPTADKGKPVDEPTIIPEPTREESPTPDAHLAAARSQSVPAPKSPMKVAQELPRQTSEGAMPAGAAEPKGTIESGSIFLDIADRVTNGMTTTTETVEKTVSDIMGSVKAAVSADAEAVEEVAGSAMEAAQKTSTDVSDVAKQELKKAEKSAEEAAGNVKEGAAHTVTSVSQYIAEASAKIEDFMAGRSKPKSADDLLDEPTTDTKKTDTAKPEDTSDIAARFMDRSETIFQTNGKSVPGDKAEEKPSIPQDQLQTLDQEVKEAAAAVRAVVGETASSVAGFVTGGLTTLDATQSTTDKDQKPEELTSFTDSKSPDTKSDEAAPDDSTTSKPATGVIDKDSHDGSGGLASFTSAIGPALQSAGQILSGAVPAAAEQVEKQIISEESIDKPDSVPDEEIADAVPHTLPEAKDSARSLVSQAVGALSTAATTAADTVSATAEHVGITLSKSTSETVSKAGREADDVGSTIQQAMEETEKSVEKTIEDTGKDVKEKVKDAREAINKSADDLRKTIETEGAQILSKDSTDEAADAMKTAEEVVGRVTSAAQEKAADADAVIAAVQDSTETTVKSGIDSLTSGLIEMTDEAKAITGTETRLICDVESSVEDKGALPLASADQTAEQASAKISSTTDSIQDAAIDFNKDLKQQVETSAQSTVDMVKDGVHEASQQVLTAVKSADEALKSKSKGIGEKVDDVADVAKDMKEEIRSVSKEAEGSFSDTIESTKEDITSTAKDAAKSAADAYQETKKEAAETAESVQTTVTGKTDDIKSQAEKAAEVSQETLKTTSEDAKRQAEQASSSLVESIQSEIQSVQDKVGAVATGIKEGIISGSEDLKEKAQSTGESAGQAMSKSAQDVQDRTQAAAQYSKETVTGGFESASVCVHSAGEAAGESLTSEVTQVKDFLDSVSDTAQQDLTSSVQDIKTSAADAAKTVEDAVANTAKTSIERASDQAKSMTKEAEGVLSTATNEAKDTAEATERSSEKALKDAVQGVKELVEVTGKSSKNAFSDDKEKLADQATSASKTVEESLASQLKETKDHDETTAALGQAAASSVQDVKDHAATLTKSTDEFASASAQDVKFEADSLLSDAKDKKAQAAEVTKTAVDEVFKEAGDAKQQVTSSLTAAADALKTRSESASGQLKSAVEEVHKDAAAGIQQTKDSVETAAKHIQHSLSSGKQEVSAMAEAVSKSSGDVLFSAVESAADDAKSARKTADEALATGFKQPRDQADSATTAMEKTVTDGADTLKEQSATVAKAAGDAFTTGVEDAHAQVKDAVQDAKDLKSQIEKSSANVVEEATKKAVETKLQAEGAMAAADKASTSAVEGAETQIKSVAQEVDKAISLEVEDAKNEMETVAQDLGKVVQVKVSETTKGIGQVDKTLTAGVQGALQQAKNAGEAVGEACSKTLAGAEEQAQEVVSSAIEAGRDVTQQAQETTSSLQKGVTEALSSTDDQLSSAVKEAEHTVNLGIEKLGQLSREADSQLSQAAKGAAKTADDSVRSAADTLSQVGRQTSESMHDAEDAARETAGSLAAGVESVAQGVSSGLSEAERGLQAGAERAAAEAGEMAESMYQSAEETLEEASSSVRSTFGGLFGFGRRKSKDTKESKETKEPESKEVKESPKAEKKSGGGFFSKMFGRRSPEEPPKSTVGEPEAAAAKHPSQPEQRQEAVEELVVRRDIHASREEDRRSSSELSDIREEASGSSSTREPSSPRVPSSFEVTTAGAEGDDPPRRTRGALDPMTSSLHESFHDVMTGSFHEALQDGEESLGLPGVEFRQPRSPPQSLSPSVNQQDGEPEQPVPGWGPPLGLPSPVPPPDHGGVQTPPPTKRAIMSRARASDSPRGGRISGPPPVYLDLVYVPHHANSFYSGVQFFHRVRARYYVFSSIEPSREVFNALLEAKQHWEDKDLEVTIIPTYDTDTLGHWFASNEQQLEDLRIDLAPSASRCTINLQDHETSCAAYRLEF